MSLSVGLSRQSYASRFLRPPSFFKRAALRDKPRRRIGPFENEAKKFVRLREKARNFCLIPPPRLVPTPRPIQLRLLQPVDRVPTISAECLSRRLEFLLGPKAKLQQLNAKLLPGWTPYQAEKFAWEKQMVECRKIYRAQYLQKLAEVTEEERLKQQQLHLQERDDRRARREAKLHRVAEERKRRALLIDRRRIEQSVTQALEVGRLSRRRDENLQWLSKVEARAELITREQIEPQLERRGLELFTREVSAPDILRQLAANPGRLH
eukprot:GHVT01100796.1.p1 GENE.GHVT01100796.1~~GHVT01100796.1.p1  ORF type:complete len:266 (+),score=42.38 GHVT01100796.1:170-967(+)